MTRVINPQGFACALTFVAVFTFSAILVQKQAEFWNNIANFMPEKAVVEVYWKNASRRQKQTALKKPSPERNVWVNNADHFEKRNTTKHRVIFSDNLRHSFNLVQGLSAQLYVYTALWDVTNVRVLSIKRKNIVFQNLLCVLYYTKEKGESGIYVKPLIKELHAKNSLYKSTAIKCPTREEDIDRPAPLFVGLVEDKLTKPKARFPVENRDVATNTNLRDSDIQTSRREDFVEFTLCVPALYKMSNAAQLVEKVEMSRLLGVGRVVFYNFSISSNVDAVLRMYTREWAEGRETLQVVVLPWKLPKYKGKPLEIRYFAQQLAMDDCLFRYKRLSKYMTFHDLDEFPVPLKHDNWSALVAERRRFTPDSIGWLFRCSVLNKDRPSPAIGYEADHLRYGSAIFGLTSRDKFVFPPEKRPKLIVDPMTIDEMGVHRIFDGNGTIDNLPVNIGLLFHYRNPLEDCAPQFKETRVVDRYGERLVARLKEIWSKLSGVELGWTPFQAKDKRKCNVS